MSNKDSDGFERAWMLETVLYTANNGRVRTRSRVIANPDYPSATEINLARAFAACAKDAIVHDIQVAQEAMNAHLQDLNKWP